MFEAVIFDCDGVLLDTETAELQVELEVLAGLGLHIEYARYCAGALGAHRPQQLIFLEMLFRERLVPASGVVLLRARSLSADFLWRRLQFAMDELGELLTERYTVIENSRIRTRSLR